MTERHHDASKPHDEVIKCPCRLVRIKVNIRFYDVPDFLADAYSSRTTLSRVCLQIQNSVPEDRLRKGEGILPSIFKLGYCGKTHSGFA